MSEHDRFEELAYLAAIGELSRDEHEEFIRHKETCPKCREIVAETSSVATAAFLAGSPKNEDPAEQTERHHRLRDNIARRLPVGVPASFGERYKHLVAAGIAAAFLLGAGIGTAVGYRALPARIIKTSLPVDRPVEVQVPKAPVLLQDEGLRLQAVVADLQKRMEETHGDNVALRDKLALSERHTTELEARLNDV